VTRIIAGRARGRRVKIPSAGTRPTSDRLREALFASVESRLRAVGRGWQDVAVADLWAGSGAVGLEAWSRGAPRVLLVEKNPAAVSVMMGNVSSLDADGEVECRRADVGLVVTSEPPGGPFDVIFADPPYAYDDASLSGDLGSAVRSGWCAPDALVIVERASKRGRSTGERSSQGRTEPDSQDMLALPPEIKIVDHRVYGDSALWYGRVSGP
jgi:16S rRNA (guanine966-N2)-methyltransferase|tara:strand:- start:1511 stop:2146 length:636 start_codon:yes stop_codon:yes gene_type:complete